MAQEYWVIRSKNNGSYGNIYTCKDNAYQAAVKAIRDWPDIEWNVVRLVEAPAEPEPSAAVNENPIYAVERKLNRKIDARLYDLEAAIEIDRNELIERIKKLEKQPAQPRLVRAAFDEPWAPALACVPEWVTCILVSGDGEMVGYEHEPINRGNYKENVAGSRFQRLGMIDLKVHNLGYYPSIRKVIR